MCTHMLRLTCAVYADLPQEYVRACVCVQRTARREYHLLEIQMQRYILYIREVSVQLRRRV